MVKLNNWEDIIKPLFLRHMPAVISAREMLVFRKLGEVFSGRDKDGEAHQCFCGDLFYLGKEVREKVPRDWLGNPLCPKCGNAPEVYEDQEWRRKFNLFGKITDALDHLEKSEAADVLPQLKEIKALAKGLFEFNTVPEMYLGYYRLLTELKKDDDDPAQSLRYEWRALIDSLFEKGKHENLEEFISFIFSPDPLQIRQIEDTIREAQRAVVRVEKDYFLSKISDFPVFISQETQEGIAESRMRFSLLLYNHLIELNALYDLTMNLINVSSGRKIENEPIPKSYRYPKQKIPFIAKQNSDLGEIFIEFWLPQVRNAFAHSKYKLVGGYFVKTDEDFTISMPDLQAKIDLCSGYWRYLQSRIAKEQVYAMEKKVFHTSDGKTIVISGDKMPIGM